MIQLAQLSGMAKSLWQPSNHRRQLISGDRVYLASEAIVTLPLRVAFYLFV